jgi:CRP-like cAMP-binding protein
MLEDSEVIRFRIDELKSLSKKNLTVSNFSLNMIKEHAVFLEYKLNNLQFMTSEERYSSLISDFPDILQKVSLTDISSYLGIARETLSRIRGRQ